MPFFLRQPHVLGVRLEKELEVADVRLLAANLRKVVALGCRYRWPYDGSHPDYWQPPLKGVVLDQTDPRAWQGTLAFPCRDGALPDADKVKAHVQRCHGEGLLNDKVPVLYQRVDAAGPFV